MTTPDYSTKCPRCFHVLPPDVYAWTLKAPDSVSVDEPATAYTGHTVTMGEVHTSRMPSNAGPDWSPLPDDVPPSSVDQVCPTCHYVLLPQWRAGHATCIAMAGARWTGKTVYIAVLIKQLQRLAEQYDEVVEPADQVTRERYRTQYEQPLYEEQGIIAATPSATAYAHHPLIFSIGIWNGQTRYLVIRDVAGEDLENPQNVTGPVHDFFSRADSVFFLFDPLRVPEIAAELQDMIPIPPVLGGDPREVLRTVLDLVGAGTPSIAVILSKFDAFQKLAEVENGKWSQAMGNAGAAYNRDPGLVSRQYDHADGQLVDAEIKSLLHRLGAGPQLRRIRNVYGQEHRHQFFVVSALGESPTGEKLHRNGISSFRCADPVRWLLAGTGALEDPAWAPR
ncbi:putative ESX-1 scaffolding and assembly protein SaeC [Gordonia spumicola]|uniref:Putative ESX-1 scaffolding and assembly protein SaeC n=1 Tax=Gordonia spumicola TaxID=589161 RepID=A0A7I9V5K3_9ACTN|nr:hypothetical protein [Gordonia spumicola]GEE00698.1 putative ESX-1 scaffolding and assembly protein SaeC [Gordonia spumicola]